jgi:hypothetical protein
MDSSESNESISDPIAMLTTQSKQVAIASAPQSKVQSDEPLSSFIDYNNSNSTMNNSPDNPRRSTVRATGFLRSFLRHRNGDYHTDTIVQEHKNANMDNKTFAGLRRASPSLAMRSSAAGNDSSSILPSSGSLPLSVPHRNNNNKKNANAHPYHHPHNNYHARAVRRRHIIGQQWLHHPFWRCLMIVCTLILLFGLNLQILLLPPSADFAMAIVYTMVLILLSIDLIIRMDVEPNYFYCSVGNTDVLCCGGKGWRSPDDAWANAGWALGSILFYCELLALLTLVHDIQYIAREHFREVRYHIVLDPYGVPVRT